jgi:aminoglycoside phosphotransferase family enzyme
VTRARAGKTASRKTQSLATALIDPACYDHEVGQIHLAETHISWVFLTGRYAYKVKKPVKLPFLDFSTLKKRHHFCREELRLNRRLAPDLYLGVVPIGGSMAAPRVGRKPAFEYAVKMVQFDPDDRLDLRLKRNAVPPKAIASFAAELAEFHGRLPPVHGDQAGRAARTAALDNFAALESSAPRAAAEDLDILHEWTEHEADGLAGVLARRAAAGAHRECHGDLHLENLLWHDGSIVAYDALEFDRALREIDVVSEASFLAMDLIAHGRPGLAYGFLNRYFEVSGDYDGIHVLRFYLVYRALVRAKVRAIKAAQAACGTTRTSRRRSSSPSRGHRCCWSRMACPAAARPRSPTSSWADCLRSGSDPTSSASACTASVRMHARDPVWAKGYTARTRPG